MARGRRTAAACSAIAVLAVLGALWAGRGWLRESWLIWKIEHGNVDDLRMASLEIGTRRCGRATLPLLRAWAKLADPAALEERAFNIDTVPRNGYLLQTFIWIRAPAAPRLIEALSDADPLVRLAALLVLEWKVPPGPEAMPALEKLLRDPSSSIRGLAAAALLKLGPEGRARALKAVGNVPDVRSFLRKMAGDAPYDAGSPEMRAAAVGDCLRIDVPEIRNRALKCLLRMLAGKYVSSHDKARQEELRERFRKAASVALSAGMEDWTLVECEAVAWEISRGARPTETTENLVPSLIECLDVPSDAARYTAVYALDWFMKKAAPAVPRLIPLLSHPRPDIRLMTTRCLYWIGPEAEAALPALESMCASDSDPTVRHVASKAIEAIRGDRAAGPAPPSGL